MPIRNRWKAAHGVTERCDIMDGSMFTSVPRGGDAYVFKSMLLDEEDEKVCTILKICREAIPASGRLFVIEPLATEPNRQEISLLDMTMLVMTGGRKRKLEEYEALFSQAGFRVEQTVANRSPFGILTGVPV